MLLGAVRKLLPLFEEEAICSRRTHKSAGWHDVIINLLISIIDFLYYDLRLDIKVALLRLISASRYVQLARIVLKFFLEKRKDKINNIFF